MTRLYDWETNPRKDVKDLIKSQGRNTQLEFQDRAKFVIGQLAEQSLNAAIYYENPDPKSYVSMVPTSAATGDGMGNLMGLIVELTQTALSKRLMYSDELQVNNKFSLISVSVYIMYRSCVKAWLRLGCAA